MDLRPNEEPGRKTPAKGVHLQPDLPNFVFLTVGCRHGEQWLANTVIHRALREIWLHDATAWRVGYYLLMPDHLHLFCAPHDRHVEIERWISYWKFKLVRATAEAGRWHRGGFHHRLRSRPAFDQKWHYVAENPIRRGLVSRSEDWPFQGQIHSLVWT